MKFNTTSFLFLVGVFTSTVALAGDYENFSERFSFAYASMDADANDFGVKIELNVMGVEYSNFFNPINSSEYPVDERSFTNKTDAFSAGFFKGNGNSNIFGITLADLSINEIVAEYILSPRQSPYFAIAKMHLTKVETSGNKNIPGVVITSESASTNIVKFGAGMYIENTTAIYAILGGGKDKLDNDSVSHSPAANTIKSQGIALKQVAKLSGNQAYSLLLEYESKSTSGEDGYGARLKEKSTTSSLETKYYIDNFTALGVQYETHKLSDEYRDNQSLLGDGKTTSLIISKHASPSLNLQFLIRKLKGNNMVTADATTTSFIFTSYF